MGNKTKVSIKVKGTAHGVKKALSKIVSDMPVERTTPLREADFRGQAKRNSNGD